MHELSIAMSLVEQAAIHSQGAVIRRIEVLVGALSGVDPEPLTFCFPLASQGTPAEGAELVLKVIEPAVFCRTCNEESPAGPEDLRCPACGSGETELRHGDELILSSLEVESPDE